MCRDFCRRKGRAGFTLIELLVVVGIIAILVSILIPAAAMVMKISRKASTAAEIGHLQTAIQNYFQDWNAYPGPIPESQIYGNNMQITQTVTMTGFPSGPVSSSENLVLALSGGIDLTTTAQPQYDPSQIGKGPMSLNALNPRQYNIYFDTKPQELANDGMGNLTSWTQAVAHLGQGLQPLPGTTFSIPEYLDHYSFPRPIIYLRAITGASGIADNLKANKPPTDYTATAATAPTPYYSMEMSPYWVGPGGPTNPSPMFANPPPAGYTYTDAYTFFQNPSQQDSPRNKDSFILISAGYDGIYGTDDDVMYPPP